jgi:peptide deformylase
MPPKPILQLGNPQLYDVSTPVVESDLAEMQDVVADLHDTMIDFRITYGAGRAIAAPQIGVMKRLIYMHVNNQPTVFINPTLDNLSEEMIEVWDDCMCFPNLTVKVLRHKSCRIRYRNLDWKEEEMELEDDLSELLQHECDHLDGILAVSRAIDAGSFALRSERTYLSRE